MFRRPFRSFSSGPFDAHTKTLQKARAALSPDAHKYDYLRNLIADQLVDRLQDIRHPFKNCLDFCSGAAHFYHAAHDKYPLSSITHVDVHSSLLKRAANVVDNNPSNINTSFKLLSDFQYQPKYDLIISTGSLHWQNEIPPLLSNFSAALSNPGILLLAVPGLDTLQELRISLQLAENELYNRLAPRISPTIRPPDAAALLHATEGLSMTTVDVERMVLRYANMDVLMKHIRGMGEGNALKVREPFLRNDVRELAGRIYNDKFAGEGGGVEATFDIIHMIAWKGGGDMPMERGSAESSLADLTEQTKPPT